MGRSIKDSVNDAAFDFVKGGFEEPQAAKPNVVDIKQTQKPAKPKREKQPKTETEPLPEPVQSPPARKAPASPQPLQYVDHRVSLSTRMRASLLQKVKREGLRRQLDGIEPQTVQAILEEATEQWLKRNSSGE